MISTTLVQNAFHTQTPVNLGPAELDFKFAFGIQGYYDQQSKADPRYVKFEAHYQTRKDGQRSDTVLEKHLCTAADYAEFYEPSDHFKSEINTVKQLETLWCLDDYSQVDLFGNENGDFGRLNILVLPCNFGLVPGEKPQDNALCETDHQA